MKNTLKGNVTPAILIITTAFVIVIYGLLFLLTLQFDFSHRQVASERALHVAEAGVNYYRWHLAHSPEDYQDGTGAPGPYLHEYKDPQGQVVGYYSLEISPPEDGSSIVTITSTGWISDYPNVRRTIRARYGIPSFSEFSFLSNSSAWYGVGSTVNGKVHSNNGIRMDGTNSSVISSAKDEYMCGDETGCHPPTRKPGVWGAGDDELWEYPVPAIDFDTITLDLEAALEAADENGLHLPESEANGYHLVFNDDSTVTVSRVTGTDYLLGYSVPGQGLGVAGEGGCRREYQLITDEETIGTYNITENPIIFIEDHLWVEGTVRGRVSVVAAEFPVTSENVNIWIPNSINYTAYDGSDVLGLIALNDIYFARDLPEQFNIDAILMAQKGKIIRHGYFDWCGGVEGAVKEKLTIFGSIISYYKSYWNFGSGPESGFLEREINFDTNALYNPPPFFPTAGEYQFISWEEL